MSEIAQEPIVTPDMLRGTLRNEDFVTTANVANVETVIAEHIVPRGMVKILTTDPIEHRLQTKESFSFTTGTAVTTQTLALAGDIIDSPDLGDVGDAAIVVRTTPTPITEWTNFTIDYAANTISLSGLIAATAYVFDVYYTFSEGSINIKIKTPENRLELVLLNTAIKTLSQRSQYNINTAPTIVNIEILPEMFRLIISVKSSRVVSWDAYARNSTINIPYAVTTRGEMPEGIIDQIKARMVG